MNTPRQPNVRASIERFPGEIRSSGHYDRTSTSFATPLMPGPKPIAAIITTGTSKPLSTDERSPIVPSK